MRFKNADLNSNGVLKEGFVLASIISAQELYVLKSGTVVFEEPSTDELDYAAIELSLCQSDVPSYTIQRRVTNPRKIKRLFDAANVKPEPGGNGYSHFIAEKLKGKEVYCLFYKDGKTERGFMTFFPLIPKSEDDFEWIEDQFKYAITEGYEFPDKGKVYPYIIHGDSLFFDNAVPEAQGNIGEGDNGNGNSKEELNTDFDVATLSPDSMTSVSTLPKL